MKQAIQGLVILAVLGAAGCKNTEDYLYDLSDVYDRSDRRLRPEVYDAGQLVHEAFSGLSEQQTLTLSQMARAVALSGYIVAMERDVVPLCQAQAVWTLGRLAVRFPVPPFDEPYEHVERAEVEDLVASQITLLGEQQERLGVPQQIALLSNPDLAVDEKALERLRQVTGQDFPRNAGPWQAWWSRNGPAFRREAADVSAEPLRIIGQSRFSTLAQAAAVLNFLGLHAAIFDMPEARDVMRRSILRVARQVVVLGIDRARVDLDSLELARSGDARRDDATTGRPFDDRLGQFLLDFHDPVLHLLNHLHVETGHGGLLANQARPDQCDPRIAGG